MSIRLDNTSGQVAGGTLLDAPVALHSQPEHLTIHRRVESGPAPLSFAQERLWFLDQIDPGAASANISRGLKITGDFNIDLFQQSLQTIVSRHESLRTTFATSQLYAGVDSKPAQLIAASGAVEQAVNDLSSVPSDQRMSKARAFAQAEAQRPFDLTIGPLLRPAVLVLDRNEYVLLLTVHRIVSDERSLDLLLDEMWQVYGAASRQLPPLPIQLADYSDWQRDRLNDEDLSTHSDYWQSRLRGAPVVLELPSDRPRPAVQNWHGASVGLVLDQQLSHKLITLAKLEHTNLFVILMTAFQILLARYSRQTDIVTGSEFANREAVETRNLIGPLANTFALRTDLSGDPVFKDLLARVEKETQEAAAHQLMPFEKLVAELQLERSMSYAPVFQVALKVREKSALAAAPADLLVEEFEFETGVSRLDLTLDVMLGATNTGGTPVPPPVPQIKGRFEYDSDLFDRGTIERLAGHFEVLLHGIVSNPGERVSALPLLTEDERRQILHEWNSSQIKLHSNQCVHELFEAAVDRNPQATALVCGDDRLTYSELNCRANQLAHYLRKLGVGPEKRVGICLGRTTEMVIAVLATLKAGGAYVPLDPAYPAERLAFTLQDSDVCALQTSAELTATLPKTNARQVLVASEWPVIGLEDTANLPVLVQPENLAYVIYTSGSTGQPKGVQISHRALTNFLCSVREEPGLTPDDVLLSVTTLSFDIAALELYLPLIVGARLVIASREAAADGAQLQLRIADARATVVQATPVTWRMLIDAGWPGDPGLKILCGGEVLPRDLADQLLDRGDSLWNMYGPTETTIWSLVCKVESEPGPLSIGRPIANTSVYLLDANLNLAPVGVPGELHIGGVGLAHGYLNRPDLTAEKFIPNSFGQSGERLYRTGDLACYRSNGKIEFLGRLDNQVKLRGFRIELGEIETVLGQHPQVEQAVVIIREAQPGDKRLVAYVVPKVGEPNDEATQLSSSLRRLLAAKLPEYMMPSAFVMLAALPLTPNRKIDRRSLPKPGDGRRDLESAYLAPRYNLERQLVNIWEKILDVKTIGVKDSFFELGGNSLLAVRLFAQIENRFGKRLPLAALFQAPTIEQLANVLRETAAAKSWSSLVAIQPQGSKPPLYCVHAAGANVLIYRPLSRHLGMDQPVYALQAQGLDGQQRPFLHVEDMAAHYIREMRGFQPEGPYHLIGASFGGLVIFEMAQQLRAQGQQVGLMAMLNTNCPVYPVSRKVRFHLAHLKEHGPGFYADAIWQTLRRRMGQPTVPVAVTTLPDPELARLVADRRHGDEALVRTVSAILDAEKDYVPRGKVYPGKITLFWAADAEPDSEDNRLGWEKLAAGGLEVHLVPGTHISIREEPHVAVLAEKIRGCLEAERS